MWTIMTIWVIVIYTEIFTLHYYFILISVPKCYSINRGCANYKERGLKQVGQSY